jgi:hypothetical protein
MLLLIARSFALRWTQPFYLSGIVFHIFLQLLGRKIEKGLSYSCSEWAAADGKIWRSDL